MADNGKKEDLGELKGKAEKLVHDLESPPSGFAGLQSPDSQEAMTSLVAEALTQAWSSPAANNAAANIAGSVTTMRTEAWRTFEAAQNAYNNEGDDVPEG